MVLVDVQLICAGLNWVGQLDSSTTTINTPSIIVSGASCHEHGREIPCPFIVSICLGLS